MSAATESLSLQEQEQIMQTIEMFEVIAQSQPDDYQSIEILKEAYEKIDRQEDAFRTSVRLAQAYAVTGQYSMALMECEGVLSRNPDMPDVLALLDEVESKMNPGVTPVAADGSGSAAQAAFQALKDDNLETAMPNLKVIDQTRRFDRSDTEIEDRLKDDGNMPFSQFLIKHEIAPVSEVMEAMDRVNASHRRQRENPAATFVMASLLEEIAGPNKDRLNELLSSLVDRTKLPYAPIEIYDVDRHVVKMLPETLTMGRMILPFDILSRTVLVAHVNPLDEAGKDAVQQLLEYNIQWYLASPKAIFKIFSDLYQLGSSD